MKLKHILIYSILIFASTFALFKFSQRNLQHVTPPINPASQQLPIPTFNFQSKFKEYAVDNNSTNKQLLGSIARELKLDINGYANFGTFDLLKPDKIIFIFADINLLSASKKDLLLNRHLGPDKELIFGLKSGFNQTTKTLTYTLYMDSILPSQNQSVSKIATYLSRIVVHILCASNTTLVKDHKVDSKYRNLVNKFNLNSQSILQLTKKETSFLYSLWQKINFVQPIFASCSGRYNCLPEQTYYACADGVSCKLYDNPPCPGDGSTCEPHTDCGGAAQSNGCSGSSVDACYDQSCGTYYCNPPEVNNCQWSGTAPPSQPQGCGDGWSPTQTTFNARNRVT